MRKFTSLTLKLTRFSTSIILLTSVFVALIVYFSTSLFFTDAATDNIKNEAKLISNDIENSLIKISNDINILLKTPPIQGIIRADENNGVDKVDQSTLNIWKDRLSVIFKSILEENRYYTQIRYIGVKNSGMEILRLNQNNQGIRRVPDTSLQNKSKSKYYKESIRLSQGSILFSKINFNIEKNKVTYPLVPTLRVLTPIYNHKNDDIFGILAINVNILRYLRNILLRSALHDDVILYDQHNDFFIFNRENKSLKFITSDEKIEAPIFGSTSIKSTNQIIPYLKSNKNKVTIFQSIYADKNKDQKVFTLAIIVPRDNLAVKDSSLLTSLLFWIFGVCILSSLIIYAYTKKMMLPLKEMAQKIQESERISDKDLYLPTQLDDEVGLLARAFEKKTKLLSKLALFDSLTGLPNRKNFIDKLDDLIQYAKNNKQLLCIIYFDLNRFKEVNDIYGHDYGDELLIKFSKKLREITNEKDVCSRLGGDEFSVIIANIKSENDILTLIKKYEDNLNTTYAIKGITLNITISGGASIYPEHSTQLDELIKYADEAMYSSKKEGKGNIHTFNSSTRNMQK